MKKNFFYVGLVFVSLGILNTSCSDSKDNGYVNTNETYVDEYGSEWDYISDSYPYWLIKNAEHNTTCRYYPYSGIYTSNLDEGRTNISKPSYVSEHMAKKIKETAVKKTDNTVSQRPRTDYAVNNYYGSSSNNFMTGYLLGSMLNGNSYGGSHYTNTHTYTTHTRTIIKEVPAKNNNTTSNKTGTAKTSSPIAPYKVNTNSSFSKSIPVRTSSSVSRSSAKGTSKSGGFGTIGRGSSSAS